jgi:hypothetical protein
MCTTYVILLIVILTLSCQCIDDDSYVIMVTLYDRLGGHPLRWSHLEFAGGASYTGVTQVPQMHDGRFYTLDINFGRDKLNKVTPTPHRLRLLCDVM